MRIAALTQVYNESFNLPIWVEYYGRNFGRERLFVIDHGSDDGSTDNLPGVNVLRMPRTPFDDARKSASLSAMHRTLLQHFDTVVVGDCDEIVAPDPDHFDSLRQFIEEVRPQAVASLGLHVHHLLDEEMPLELDRPLLAQRRIGYFSTDNCKPAISATPTEWPPGQHACNVRFGLDPRLFMFHIKYADYAYALKRHALNASNEWSQAQSQTKRGAHHRYDNARFLQEGFLVPLAVKRTGKVQPFDFSQEIAAMTAGMTQQGAMFVLGRAEPKFVEIPQRFRSVF